MKYYQIIIPHPTSNPEIEDLDDVIWVASIEKPIIKQGYSCTEITESILYPKLDGIDFFLPKEENEFRKRLKSPCYIGFYQ